MEETFDKVGMQTLLDEMGPLNREYEKLKDENKFNIFPILRRSHEEVPLHSRFIYELLNPEKNAHNEGDKFLKSFLEIVGIQDFELSKVQVRKEHKNIDILITNNQKQAIIIENKIWAEDQDRQLQRYYEQMKNQGYERIWLVYLTLHGHQPSKNSLGNLSEDVKKELITISYFVHILQWLKKCVGESSKTPFLNETIIQYKNLVKEITGNTMSEEQGKKVYELLTKDNINNAKTIESNWGYVRWFLELDFWHDFEKTIKKEKYNVLESHKYSKDLVRDAIHGTGMRNLRYGIVFELFSKDGNRFCLFIGRGERRLFYEIIIDRSGGKGLEKEYQTFANELKEQGPTEWLWGRYLQQQNINFEALTQETLALIDEKKREESLKNIWEEIEEFIEKVYKVKAEVLDKST